MYVVEHYRHPVTRGFGQTHIPRNYAFEDLGAEETSKVGSDLLGESRSVVIHRQENAFYLEGWVYRAAKTHMRVQELRNAL
jgi:hypothetical protein